MRKGTGWPVAITLLLVSVVAANILVMRVAAGDPSFAVEPDYYRKALAWDSIAAQARASELLGWNITPRLDPFTDEDGALLHARVSDSSGGAIRGAEVVVDALFNARAAEIHTSKLLENADGAYSARLPVRYGGQWELRFRVRHGNALFTTSVRIEAVPAGRTGPPGAQ
jgi:nitrogen fixation protein FixH